MRNQGVPIKVIMKRLGRTRSSVRQKLHNIQDIRQFHHRNGEVAEILTNSKKTGYDSYIALKLNISKRTVRYHRSKYGIKAKVPPRWSQKLKSGGRLRFRCFVCNKLCPIGVHEHWKELTGWSLKKLSTTSTDIDVAFCKECTDTHPQDKSHRIYITELLKYESREWNGNDEDTPTGHRYSRKIIDSAVTIAHSLGLGDTGIAITCGLHIGSVVRIRKRLGLKSNFIARGKYSKEQMNTYQER